MSSTDLAAVRAALLGWYRREHRDFPWRRTREPYAVLVSEVMLQQTQASRVADRFPSFMRRFPTAADLAGAPTAHVLAEWSGLGYNRRALALQRAAAAVAADGWPTDVAGLQALSGVGPYTARAVAGLAFGRRVGVVDTNVRRWLVRRFDVADRPRALQALADRLAAVGDVGDDSDHEASAAWIHASMEFGAAVCRARAPRCAGCPIARACPSRITPAAVATPRRSRFAGSDRALRGALLRALAVSPGHALSAIEARSLVAERHGSLDRQRFERVVAGLERDGLLSRAEGRLRLGSGSAPRGMTTIGR